ncbi:MAG: DNA polymerase III, subunit gamma and tau [Candidatus Levybacteria bacterium RIFCSPHIGHO2_02_FULL_39_36]|nr:MAG: polymerase III protein [Candidatus Levybacteria bacterium GW2011_GWA1_39_11]KKR26491.1 MAG: polymerase III protein [Microgenomates group bacterium GW2011_GWC1_39_7]KKR49318.1 MAG: polymerase III protein [Candidatus Levybacteria bacterium GW2011_GWA2_40_16]OGH25984.1 MAG: DNA polymerase III, subunit gamma and tau [Candidatus Levybacteria bacterium RIFCSPHIGHO2_12_FULL_39_39]OGH27321.1 MAG: DNA polymerase III, subunit gamma and tau [Candidatus Levybacteria bacterium RIFCSPHIGHO2_02_FULL_3
MVFYRKYRPQKISELDLEFVRNRLELILKNPELPHAFLFTGPKGLGKTSAARILAKAINCEQRWEVRNEKLDKEVRSGKKKNQKITLQNPASNLSRLTSGIEPCNKCEACVSITNGSNLDVLEIDAASNRGIDEIRDLREKIKFAPANLRKKVYIIDEVHMLTTDAFNALLKTLEEPPSHAIFILCTTEEEKIPPTILSRTFHIAFKKPTKEEVTRSLLRIVKGEKLEIEEPVLFKIHELARGSFRDAAKILEELSIGYKNGKITKAVFDAVYKIADVDKQIMNLLESLSQRDIKAAISIIEELSQRGADFKTVTERTADILHQMVLKRAGVGLDVETADIAGFGDNDLTKLLDMINQSYKDIKFSVLPQIPLELAAVGWCLQEIKDERLKIKDKQGEVTEGEPISVQTKEESGEKPEERHGELFRENALSQDFFAALIATVKRDNHSIAGILRGCKLTELNDTTARFETAYKFHKDKLNETKTRLILDKRSSEILNRNVNVIVNLVEK